MSVLWALLLRWNISYPKTLSQSSFAKQSLFTELLSPSFYKTNLVTSSQTTGEASLIGKMLSSLVTMYSQLALSSASVTCAVVSQLVSLDQAQHSLMLKLHLRLSACLLFRFSAVHLDFLALLLESSWQINSHGQLEVQANDNKSRLSILFNLFLHVGIRYYLIYIIIRCYNILVELIVLINNIIILYLFSLSFSSI